MNSRTASTANKPISVLFISAEAEPFVKVGGLGDVAGSLPLSLKKLEPTLDIRLAIPFYPGIHKSNRPIRLVTRFPIQTIDGEVEALIYETALGDLPVYLIDGNPIAANKLVYGADFAADAEKFVFLSLACLYLPSQINWTIDILHANDWHTSVAIHALSLLKTEIPAFLHVKSVLTLHNLPFMGTGASDALAMFNIPAARNPRLPAWARTLPLPMGINSADKIVAVSPTYANEILTSGYGCDLQIFLQSKKKRLSGILNGIDIACWNPEDDKLIQSNYSSSILAPRSINKTFLQEEFDLEVNSKIPLLTFIGRMDRQKGIDIAIQALELNHSLPWQMIFLGTGDKTIEGSILELQSQFPNQIRSALRFDAPLSHQLYAGADMLLMPSRYEPCGLAQMIAMRYGCVPVANATGGLVDTIQPFLVESTNATGFLCNNSSAVAYSTVLASAIKAFGKSEIWSNIQINGMKQNNSWQKSAARYYELYRSLK
ncbi:MAG: glycogen synthase [Anaerolineaceae bacterium]